MAQERISREALERIIRRAAELQAGERDIGEGLTRDEVLALAKDVGIPDRYLQQALLEEQTRSLVAPEAGMWAWLAGPGTLAARRVVPGERPAVERALARWLEEQELLQVKRRFPDQTTWEPKAGAFASIQRALAGGRRYALARAGEMTTQVIQLDPGFCHVRVEADVRGQRRARVGGAAAMLALGWGATALFHFLIGSPTNAAMVAAWLPATAMTIGGLALARTHRGENGRIQLGLEQILDRLERGEIRPEHALPGSRAGAFVRVAEELRRAFTTPGAPPRG